MADLGELVLQTANGKNGKIELTQSSVRISEFKKGLLGWDRLKINRVHEVPRDVVSNAEASPLVNDFYIDFPVDGCDTRFTISFDNDYRPEFEAMAKELGWHWYDDDGKLSNVVSYDNEEKASIDANYAAKKGWMPQSTSATEGHVNVGRTVGKTILTGGIGLAVLGESRTKGKVTITYARTPEWLEAHKKGDIAKTVSTTSDSNDVVVQLEGLAKLKEQGILTEEEFQAQKKKILGT